MRINGFVKGMAALLVVGACFADNIRVAQNKEQELEQMKTEHIEETFKAYSDYSKARYEADRALYANSIDSIFSDSTNTMVKDSMSKSIGTHDLNIKAEK